MYKKRVLVKPNVDFFETLWALEEGFVGIYWKALLGFIGRLKVFFWGEWLGSEEGLGIFW
jgi:hypothetical protein